MFEKFPSLTRFSHGWTVTEKLDGTNSCVLIAPFTEELAVGTTIAVVEGMAVMAQSRKQMITPGKTTDNFGFAGFVQANAEKLVEILGEGRHYGEWLGKGIQRGYSLDKKVFALFNVGRWLDLNELDGQLRCVPLLGQGYMGEPGKEFAEIMAKLKEFGSVFAPGFDNPEGIVMLHRPSGTLFKKTFDYDEQGKWAENQARRNAA